MPVFKLPDLGEGLPDAQIREWHVKEGETISLDQPLASMETAKSVVEIPAPFAGVVAKLFGQPGDTIDTGSPLVEFGEAQAAAEAEDSGTVVGKIESSDTVIDEPAMGVVQTTRTDVGQPKAMPAVRALAKKLGVDLATVTATGKNNSITKADVESAAGSAESTAPSIGEPLSGIRQAMAVHMSEIHSCVVPATICDDADITDWPADRADTTVRMIEAIVAASKAVPMLNVHYDDQANSIRYFDQVNLGVAVNTEHGLLVPVIDACNQQSPEQLRTAINQLKQQAGDGTLAKGNDHPTIVLSNIGTHAGRYAAPVIPKPCVAIIAVGRARDAVLAIDGKPAVRRALPLSLTFDHRVITGAEAATFLKHMMDALV